MRTEATLSNLSFTSARLQANTDNAYRDPVPTLQLLYWLEDAAAGGVSSIVNGFHAACQLRDQHAHAFDRLSGYCVTWEFVGSKGVHLRAQKPVLELTAHSELNHVRFNNPSNGGD